ncbi:GIY-YIG nuclease family protein [Kordiimonas marina]|uniref:GIY-YIG nuclease family protein n=1 Tax=Kordiimonas marina TaxID=2872312 RepID=UPI00248AA984|nr:GIY-YIG nuclease family protein [Kordiimonas marina]MCJ9429487.1 GIY-YIG nuclease family protein [Kordiimonas marina]
MEKAGYTYILASKKNGTLYVGVTSDLIKRIWQHREGVQAGFTSRYNVKRLVYYEVFGDMSLAIEREKQLKRWHRPWKVNLIEEKNPDWKDLYPGLVGEMDPETSSG